MRVERFNLSQEPGAFANNEVVSSALKAKGNGCLPMVVVDERVAVEGAYPSRETLAAIAGVVVRKLEAAPAVASGCCGPSAKGPSKSGSSCC